MLPSGLSYSVMMRPVTEKFGHLSADASLRIIHVFSIPYNVLTSIVERHITSLDQWPVL
jgi:hypothetical protein